MPRLNVTDVRDGLAEAINRVAFGGERIVIHRRGKDVVALVPVADAELLAALEDRMDLDEARKALAEAQEKGTVSWDTLKAELNLG